MSLPSVDEVMARWKQFAGAAKVSWGKCTGDGRLKSEGHAQELAGLVRKRYAITRDEVDKQVKRFITKLKS